MVLLKTSLKGDRNYVRGTDFFNAIEQALRHHTDDLHGFVSKLIFKGTTTRLCNLSLSPPGDSDIVIAHGYFHHGDDKDVEFWLLETDAEINERIPFDETNLLAQATLEKQQKVVTAPVVAEYSPVECIVTLTKYLNDQLMPDIKGKWLFGQIELSTMLPEEAKTVTICLKSAIKGRFSISDVLVDDRSVGTIRFIVGEV